MRTIDWKDLFDEVCDQAAHAAFGLLAITLARMGAGHGDPLIGMIGGVLCGGLIGLLAELKEEDARITTGSFRRINGRDIMFYALGGAIGGLL